MNEISKQIIEIGKLIGKKVFIIQYVEDYNSYYGDRVKPVVFTIADFENYAYGLINGVIELLDIDYKTKFEKYYLVIFQQL